MLEEAANVGVRTVRDFKGLKLRQISAAYWVFCEIDREDAIKFMHHLGTGIEITVTNPIYILRQKLINDMAAKKKFSDLDKMAWTFIAWNHWRANTKLTKIQWSGDKFPVAK